MIWRHVVGQAPFGSLAEFNALFDAGFDAEIASMSATLGSLSTTVRRLSSKYGMQDVRARRKEESPRMPADLTPSEKKAWLRRELQAGRLQVSRDGVVVAAAGQKSDDE